MTTTVEIDIEMLSTALTGLEDLRTALSEGSRDCRKESPVSLPSLDGSRMVSLQGWLTAQVPELETRRDLAVLLNEGGSTGTISFDVEIDSLDAIEERLGEELANGFDGFDPDAEPGTGLDIADLLSKYQSNPDVTSSMYETMGPERSAEVLRLLSLLKGESESYGDEYTDLYGSMTTAMTSASQKLDRDFGEEFTHWLMPADALSDEDGSKLLESMTMMQGPNVLADLFEGGALGPEFLKGSADEVERAEQHLDAGPGNVWDNITGRDVGDLLMKQLANHPSDALDWFNEDGGRERQTYWFNDRDFSGTGYDGIAEVVDKMSTDPTLMETRRGEATQIATTFFDLVANSNGFDPENAKASADSLSHIMATYMPAVMNGVTVRGDADWPLADGNFEMSPFGEMGEMPLFQHDDLASIAAVAMSTEEGLTNVADGYGQLTTQRMQALGADGTVESGALSSILTDDAGLRGFLDRAVADSDIRAGTSADERAQYFSSVVSEVVGAAPIPYGDKIGESGGELLKSGYEYAYNYAIDRGEEAANDRWAGAEEAARANAVSTGENGFNQSKYGAYQALVESGLITEADLIDGTSANGSVKPYADLSNPLSYNDNLDALIIEKFDLDPNIISQQYLNNYDDPFAGVR